VLFPRRCRRCSRSALAEPRRAPRQILLQLVSTIPAGAPMRTRRLRASAQCVGSRRRHTERPWRSSIGLPRSAVDRRRARSRARLPGRRAAPAAMSTERAFCREHTSIETPAGRAWRATARADPMIRRRARGRPTGRFPRMRSGLVIVGFEARSRSRPSSGRQRLGLQASRPRRPADPVRTTRAEVVYVSEMTSPMVGGRPATRIDMRRRDPRPCVHGVVDRRDDHGAPFPTRPDSSERSHVVERTEVREVASSASLLSPTVVSSAPRSPVPDDRLALDPRRRSSSTGLPRPRRRLCKMLTMSFIAGTRSSPLVSLGRRTLLFSASPHRGGRAPPLPNLVYLSSVAG